MVNGMLWRSRLAMAGVVLLCGTLASTAANAVLIDITGASFTPGTGYGTDANEGSSPTLLGVAFSTSAFSAQSFTLNSVGDSLTFTFGTVNLQEPNSNGGIVAGETDNLGVTANFIFTNPLGSTEMVSADGTATTGSVSDSFVDYVLDWSPIQVAFGVGGLLEISLLDLSFTTQSILTQTATVTLLSLPRTVIAAVPEPGSLLLFGAGLAAVGVLARRRRR